MNKTLYEIVGPAIIVDERDETRIPLGHRFATIRQPHDGGSSWIGIDYHLKEVRAWLKENGIPYRLIGDVTEERLDAARP